jgi:uncharacterized tellurite resistance protein B-like protein
MARADRFLRASRVVTDEDCGMLAPMVLRRFLGLGAERAATAPAQPSTGAVEADTGTIRRIVAAIEALPAEQRRYVAAFAYILGRTAHADLVVTDEEVGEMERIVIELSDLPEPQAVLVVQMARAQNQLYGGTEDYLVTREFKEHSTHEQRIALLRSCFAVGAAEGTISAEESALLNQISKELDIPETELNSIRGEFTDRFAAIQRMRAVTGLSADQDEDPTTT